MEEMNTMMYSGIIFCVLSFLSGSVPYGLIYSLIRGVDIRKVGSGNIGATNVARQFGFWQGFMVVFVLDITKGILPVVLFKIFASRDIDTNLSDLFEILIGISAILGHVFSPFLGFKGGKGVATTTGVLFAWNYIVGILCLVCFTGLFVTVAKKIVGRASVMMSVLFPLIVFFVPDTTNMLKIVSVLLGILILLAHRKNIREWYTGEDLQKKLQAKQEKEADK